MDPAFPSRFEGPGESPGFLLWQVSMAWQRAQREALAAVDLTHVQFVLLASASWLAHAEGTPPTQAELARQARIDAMMTSQVLRALETRGLVTREADPDDARARRVRVTRAGATALRAAMPIVEEVDSVFFASLAAPRTAEAFRRALAALAGARPQA